jgi:hypothetical protein
VDVRVINPDNQQDTLLNGYTYIFTNPAPTVTSVVPNSGPIGGGTAVTITGTGFMGGAVVTFGTFGALSTAVISATQIQCTTAPATGFGTTTQVNVTVTNPDTQFGVLTNGFTYVAPAGQRVAAYTIDSSPGVDLWWYDFTTNGVLVANVMIGGGMHTNGADPQTDVYVLDWQHAEILGYMSQRYLRNFDGTKTTGVSFNICFVGVQPTTPWIPPPANQGPAQSFQYNVMELYDTDPNATSALGRAGLDFTTNGSGMPVNGRRENNARGNGLGCFMQPIWNNLQSFGRVSVLNPVLSATDRQYVDGSYVLGSGTAGQDARFTAIRNNIQGFADGLSTVGMHETGHSVGLVVTARGAGNHCTVGTCPMQAVASWNNTAFCTGTSSCTAELAVSLGYSP